MTTVFIVRPFGTKAVAVKGPDGKDTSVKVDFNQVELDLIQQALKRNGLRGETTGAIVEAGKIRLVPWHRGFDWFGRHFQDG